MGKHSKKKAAKPPASDAAEKDVKSTPQAKSQTKATAEKNREEKKKKEDDPQVTKEERTVSPLNRTHYSVN